ncbi:hypothetical protein ACFWFI_23350 [Streptomyces sp. NPDC060209]|uniref:hypothetical protein n=1 Tax=Streptomyces sp. NPDC060209 TaxID=3347073 RepID=UPI003658A740
MRIVPITWVDGRPGKVMRAVCERLVSSGCKPLGSTWDTGVPDGGCSPPQQPRADPDPPLMRMRPL